MIIEPMSVSVSQKKKQELGKALGSLVGPLQVQRGCLSCRLLESLPQQDSLHLEARWECQEDLIRHLQSAGYRRLLLLMEPSTTTPVVEFLYVAEVEVWDWWKRSGIGGEGRQYLLLLQTVSWHELVAAGRYRAEPRTISRQELTAAAMDSG